MLNFYTRSYLFHFIHPQIKTPCVVISYSSIIRKETWAYEKKKREREPMKMLVLKKIRNNFRHMKVQQNNFGNSEGTLVPAGGTSQY